MSDRLLLIVLSLGVFRAWRLVGRDDITATLRTKVPARFRFPVACPWCLGAWCSFAAVFAVDRWYHPLALPVVWAGAVAAVVGLLGEIDRKLGD